MSDVTRIIGIDFGTSTSVVCVKRYQGGEALGGAFLSASVTFGNGQGDTRAYTVVRRNGDGTYTCGQEAGDEVPGSETFREFKMDLEAPDEARRAQARTLTEAFFKYLYRWYDHQRSNLGEAGDREKTIVSYPAKWSEDTRRFMAEAAKRAGFPNVSVMDEPSAALYATLTQNMNDVNAKGLLRAGEPGYMLLIDMGAGTTDLAVCRYAVDAGAGEVIRADQIKNEIVSTWPESADAPTFGGREVDRLLEGYLTDYMISCGLPGDMARQLVCGTAAVKPWKESVVSARLNEGNTVDTCGFLSGYMMLLPKKQPFPAIDRAKFEGLLAEKLEGFKSLVTGCLDKASQLEPAIAQNGVDLVVLTGGHSAWYFTEELLSGTMPGVSHPALKRVQSERARVMRLSNPQETVALGLVYSLLPMKVEKETEREQKKAVAEIENVLKETIKKKEETDSGRREGPEDRAAPLTRSDRADRYFWRWVTDPANALPGWTVTCPVKYAVRWSHKQGREYTFSVTEEGVHIENMERSSEQWRKDISWEEFLSGQLRTSGFRVELQRHGTQDLCLAAIADYAMLKHLLKLLAGLREDLCGEASPHRQRDADASNKTYVWDDRLFSVIDNFFKSRGVLSTGVCPENMEARFKNALHIPIGDKIYIASCPEYKSLFSFKKTWTEGWALTSSGIYEYDPANPHPNRFSWHDLLNGEIISGPNYIKMIGAGLKDKSISLCVRLSSDIKDTCKLLTELQTELRKAADKLCL